MARLRVDAAVRRFCGCYGAGGLPHESKFSRAFAEFAATETPQQLHAAVIAATQSKRRIGHIARDSTAIAARERVPRAVLGQKKINEEHADKEWIIANSAGRAGRKLTHRGSGATPKRPFPFRLKAWAQAF